jgi:hypothetical protein
VVNKSMLAEIQRLRGLSVTELQVEWQRLYAEPSRSRNKEFLFRRLAWRCQELQYGGLSDRAKAMLIELAPDGFTRGRTPTTAGVPRDETPDSVARPRTIRDIRLPSPGTVISRQYRGRELRLLVLDDGFELEGVRYGSLSEAARVVTGQHWNGRLFWGLTQRRRKA